MRGKGGGVDDVLARAEVAGPKESLAIPQLLQQVRKAILISAARGLSNNKLGDANPALKLALKMAMANLKPKPSKSIEEGIASDEAVRLVLNQVALRTGNAYGLDIASFDI